MCMCLCQCFCAFNLIYILKDFSSFYSCFSDNTHSFAQKATADLYRQSGHYDVLAVVVVSVISIVRKMFIIRSEGL